MERLRVARKLERPLVSRSQCGGLLGHVEQRHLVPPAAHGVEGRMACLHPRQLRLEEFPSAQVASLQGRLGLPGGKPRHGTHGCLFGGRQLRLSAAPAAHEPGSAEECQHRRRGHIEQGHHQVERELAPGG